MTVGGEEEEMKGGSKERERWGGSKTYGIAGVPLEVVSETEE